MNQNMTDKKKDRPFVFVRCMTFNHEAYIKDALNGFVMQQTTFPFVVAIINDASTDKTKSVINEFVENNCIHNPEIDLRIEEYGTVLDVIVKDNPHCIFHIVHLNENHYGKKSKLPYFAKYENAAKYVGMCEGDDYWTDPLKLQKQVDILEADETLMAVCSDTSIVDNHSNLLNAKRGGVVKDDIEGRYTLRDFFRGNHQYPTASVVYRNTHKEEIRQKMAHTRNTYLGDWTMWICLHIFGDFYYINEPMVAYRINPTSVTHTCNRVGRAKANWTICRAVADILPEEYSYIAADLRKPNWAWISLMFAYKAEKKYLRMLGCAMIALFKCPRSLWNTFKKLRNK